MIWANSFLPLALIDDDDIVLFWFLKHLRQGKVSKLFVQIKKHNCFDTSGFPCCLVSDARYNIDIYLEFAIRFQVDIWRQVRMQKSGDPL